MSDKNSSDSSSGSDDESDSSDKRRMRRMEAFDEASSGSDSNDEDSDEKVSDDGNNDIEQDSEDDKEEDGGESEDDYYAKKRARTNEEAKKKDHSHIPLFERVAGRQEESLAKARVVSDKESNVNEKMSARAKMRKERQRERELREGKEDKKERPRDNRIGLGRANKNLPSEMSSNRPVSRFREVIVDPSLKRKKSVDPRFSDLNGKLNESKFHKGYDFLDAYQEDEIHKLERAHKKVKSTDTREVLKAELGERKQQMKDRRRKLAVQARLEEMKKTEKSKVAAGKKPFFPKKSTQKEIELEEKYNELKSSGGLKKYMEKKRLKNAQKDRRWMPNARGDREDDA